MGHNLLFGWEKKEMHSNTSTPEQCRFPKKTTPLDHINLRYFYRIDLRYFYCILVLYFLVDHHRNKVKNYSDIFE
jgi:hypothetical protein